MASPVDTTVKFYRDDFPGAPVLNGVAGATLALIEACGITGFGLRTAVSLTVSGGVATMVLASDVRNPNLLYSVVLVDGVTGPLAGLNGEQRITAATLTELKFATALADGAASGTITVKTAPFGLTKVHSGTNKGAYKFSSPEASGLVLRVDDTGTNTCRVVGYEAMSDVDTGTGPYPTAAQQSGGLFWPKSSTADATARPWMLFADAQMFYPAIAPLATQSSTYFVPIFGDIISNKGVDAWRCMLSGAPTNGVASGSGYATGSAGHAMSSSAVTALDAYIARGSIGLSGALSVRKMGPMCTATALGASGGSGNAGYASSLAWPNPADNSLRLGEVDCIVGSDIRGRLPGVHHTPQPVGGAVFSRGQVVDGAGVYAGRRLMAIPIGDPSGAPSGVMFVDITGPWRPGA